MPHPSFTLKTSALLIAAAFAAPAYAQDTSDNKVVITGSSIKRIEGETALPVQVLKRADIERIGAASTEELVKQLSSLSSAGSSTTVANASGYGGGNIATVSLRGLGGGRTLVLVNGRRVSVYGGGSAGAAGSSVDVNSIPLAAIERVEVLKDGASAVYGSDAIAGVVNFILRRDFKGYEVSGTYGQPTRGSSGRDGKASLFAGFGSMADDGYNLTAGINLQKTTTIYGYERDFARRLNVEQQNDYLSSISFPANVAKYGTGALISPVAPNCGPVSQVSPYAPTRCSFDNSPSVSLQPEFKKASLVLNGRKKLGADSEMYFEGGYTQNKINSTTQAVPMAYNAITTGTNPYVPQFKALMAQYPGVAKYAGTYGIGGFVLVPSSPYYPTAWATSNGLAGLPLLLNYRDDANGVRKTLDTSENARLLLGARGTWAGWDLDTGLLYSQSKVKEDLLRGYAQYSKVLPILNSGVINPFGETTDKNALAQVQEAEFRGTSYSTKTSTTSLDFKGSRELYQLPAGMLAVALGAELRQEKFEYNPSVAIQTGDIAGLGGNAFPVTGQRHVESFYAEASIPILAKLDGDVAVRYDHYQGVGSTVNPKASLRWQPSSTWLVRSSVGTGFRAPSLTDLYTPQATSVTANGTRDPIRCPDIKTGSPSDCNFQFLTLTGGNPSLKPEKSLSWTFGVMFEPTRDLSVAVDAFRVNLKDAIVVGGLSSTYFLANADRARQYAAFIQRGAPDGNPSGVGPITGIVQTNANLFKTQLAGIDLDSRYGLRFESGSRLMFRLSGTYLAKYDVQGPSGAYTSSLDQALNAAGGVILRWKHNAAVTYGVGPFEATLAHNYQKGYTDVAANRAPAGTPVRKVEPYQTLDLQLAYNGIRNTRLTLGVKNLTDRDPPYTNLTSNFLGGYDVSYGDPRGRFVYLSGTYSWK
ncbi:TonB-dependent receptor [Massilia arenosa]|uniref:TonB-dependent receptor n=1 Tax=Zemynaea arenosa TaxID=2561931 RepID=A0A4Y9SFQ2_9BURK|nr:TonB-dependent receptor [Massilia arenosa]TFW19954.1 TonB-dependent receptor [Massilia arenosa]